MKYMRYVIFALLLIAPLGTGCSTNPSASPAFTPQAECERNGGWWHAGRGICEHQGTSDGGAQR